MAGIIVISFFAVNLRITYRVKGPCLFSPLAEWTMLQPQPETLITQVRGNNPPSLTSLRFMQFDRTDFVTFSLDPRIRIGGTVRSGEIIGQVQSTANRIGYEELSGEMQVARSTLASLKTGQKASIRQAAVQALHSARQALHDYMPIWERKKESVEKDLISVEEFDLAEAQRNLLASNVAQAEASLRTVETGEKPEELDIAAKMIAGLETRLGTYDQKLSALSITAPFDGVLSGPVDSLCTIFTLSKLDTLVVEIPVEELKSLFVKPGARVLINVVSAGTRILETRIVSLDRKPIFTNGQSMYVARACIANPDYSLPGGLIAYACIMCEDVMLKDIFKSWVRKFTRKTFI